MKQRSDVLFTIPQQQSDLEVAMTYFNYTHREKLERALHLDAAVPSRSSRWFSSLKAIATSVLNAFTQDSNAPRIWFSLDASGQKIWHTYDPITNSRGSYETERDVRTWLEHRYYDMAR
ncbi:MAG: hypothetical protein EA367_14195 [Leptolyngbya sp. DLM2.Bin15]|nr:MAG: hypothetical protein EA367_14195 [Leptolyngbya sp. DLM2.Bin15]